MDRILHAVRDVLPDFDERELDLPWEQLDLDSFDLVTLRVTLETRLRREIPDQAWIQLKNVRDLCDYCKTLDGARWAAPSTRASSSLRDHRINMPQMAVGGLSEAWLFRELGDMHWAAICDAFGTDSHLISDELGNRLYATFVRVRWEGNRHLQQFRENDRLRLASRLTRFGDSMFFSTVQEGRGALTASLASTFASRGADNTGLLKGAPRLPNGSGVRELQSLPALVQEYRGMRNGSGDRVELRGQHIERREGVLFETEYRLNPYHDFNGVNLLYYAAYPMISDICERDFVHANAEQYGVARDWSLESATTARDVFYYANADIGDTIVFRLNSFVSEPGAPTTTASSLHRQSDARRLADIFTVKLPTR